MKVPYLDLQRVTAQHAEEIQAAISRVAASGRYLLGSELEAFEHHYAQYIGTRHCIGCANGLDALWLTLRAYIETGKLRQGDEVIVPANTYIATILAITQNHLKPVLVEPDVQTLQIDSHLIEQHITPRTRAIMLVHLYGRCSYTQEIATIAADHSLLLLEDNAQAHGCRTPQGQTTGSLGHAAAHSFYPGKNLGALGDGGAVTTNDDEIATILRALRNYGSQAKYIFRYQGRNSRLDELQAAVLNVKLPHLDAQNARRRDAARRYAQGIDTPLVGLPQGIARDALQGLASNVFHIFPVLSPRRDALQQHLAQRGIETLIHYPLPPHKQECYSQWNTLSLPVTERIASQELSLPISPSLTTEEIDKIIEAVNQFR